MTKETSECIDISAILNTYVYMDEQNSKYQNKTLSDILDSMPDDVKKTSDYKAVYNAIHGENGNSQLGQMKLVSQSMCDGTDKNGDLVIACTFQDTNGDYSACDVLNAVKSANETVGVKLMIAGYVFGEDSYSECANEIQATPDMSITMVEAKSPTSSFDVNVEQGICSITETELSEKLGRS